MYHNSTQRKVVVLGWFVGFWQFAVGYLVCLRGNIGDMTHWAIFSSLSVAALMVTHHYSPWDCQIIFTTLGPLQFYLVIRARMRNFNANSLTVDSQYKLQLKFRAKRKTPAGWRGDIAPVAVCILCNPGCPWLCRAWNSWNTLNWSEWCQWLLPACQNVFLIFWELPD